MKRNECKDKGDEYAGTLSVDEQHEEFADEELCDFFGVVNEKDEVKTIAEEEELVSSLLSIPPRLYLPRRSRDVDLVLVIDATGNMSRFLNKLKSVSTSFSDQLKWKLMDYSKHNVGNFRVRVIAFRDYYYDKEPMRASRFFNLNNDIDRQEFAEFVNGIEAGGGGDVSESALEALYEAFHSPWSINPSAKRRQIVILITDASAHSLQESRRYDNDPNNHSTPCPVEMAADLSELNGCWLDNNLIDQKAKRLILFTPESYPWVEIGYWNMALSTPITAMNGGDEVEMELIFEFIAKSI